MPGKLDGSVCAVTGAGAGIGRAVAQAFAHERAAVVVNDVDAAAADDAAAEIRAAGGRCTADHGAIGSVEAADALVRSALDTFGDLDVLVNNAGVLRDRMLHNMTEDEFDTVVRVHLRGSWACGRAAVRYWRPLAKDESRPRRRRKIINVTSASGLIGAAGQSNYAAAKMGIVGLTKSWAKELGPLGINVNAIAPAALTGMTRPLLEDPDEAQKRLARFALGRYGSPEEIAPAFVFLASSDSDYVTGQVLCIDGGLVM